MKKKKLSWLERFLDAFKQPFLIVLHFSSLSSNSPVGGVDGYDKRLLDIYYGIVSAINRLSFASSSAHFFFFFNSGFFFGQRI